MRILDKLCGLLNYRLSIYLALKNLMGYTAFNEGMSNASSIENIIYLHKII